MKKIAHIALVTAAVLSLVACGKSDKASDAAEAENVEMPAEEAVADVDAAAAPVADPSATVSASEPAASASATPEATSPTATASAKAETTKKP